jgi:hypothetical protein
MAVTVVAARRPGGAGAQPAAPKAGVSCQAPGGCHDLQGVLLRRMAAWPALYHRLLLLPLAASGSLLGYGTGLGSCAAFPFRCILRHPA